MTVKVSVLVPVFNAEKYLRECLDSVLHQTLKEIEIILINDGSTDGSLGILKEYAEKDKRAVILNKKNSGYGDSLNKGLRLARGEYIAIVEPDDFLELDAFEKLYEISLIKSHDSDIKSCDFAEGSGAAGMHRADIVRANFFNHSKKGDEKVWGHQKTGLATEEEKIAVLKEAPAIWAAIYRTEFLRENGIEFLPTPGASYQDAGFWLKTLGCAKTVVLDSEAFYHYRTDNSASSSKSTKKVENVRVEYDSAEEFLREKNVDGEFLKAMEVARFWAYAWNVARLEEGPAVKFSEEARAEFRKFQKDGLIVKKYFSLKQRATFKALMVSPKLFVKIVSANKVIKKH